jgi:hypothetical protein
VARYITPEREEDMLPAAASVAVRFAIALQDPDATNVLEISEELARYCTRHGFGLWLADTRLGTRVGNWFGICEFNPDLNIIPLSSNAVDSGYVRRCLPVTLVGPARVGSTHSLISFLSQYREIGIAACSITSLDDLAFIHLILSFADTPKELLLKVDREYDARKYSAKLPSESLIRILQLLGRDRRGDHERAGLLVNRAGDYQCLVGPSRPVKGGSMRRRMAIWFSWQTQGGDADLAIPLNSLLGALVDIELLRDKATELIWDQDAPNIEYLVCRNMGNSVLRGKGKLSVLRDPALQRYPSDGLEPRPTDLCVSIEEAWRSRTAREASPGVKDLTVAWRECWLGHWSTPL